MPRQPVTEKIRNGGFICDQSVLFQMPEFAAAIGRCAVAWTAVDVETSHLLRVLLNTKVEPVIALFNSLVNERAKREAVDAIAEYTMPERFKIIYKTLMRARTALAKERADIVHGVYFKLLAFPNLIGWANTTSLQTRPKDGDIYKLIYTYRVQDIDDVAQSCMELNRNIMALNAHIFRDDADMSLLYEWLNRTPLYQRFLFP